MKRLILFILLLVVAFVNKAQVTPQTIVSANEIGKQDILEVEYKLNGTSGNATIIEPDFKQWRLINGPVYSSQSSTINGKTERSIGFVYMLQPLSTGIVRIPAATIQLGNNKIICGGTSITVKNVAHTPGSSNQSNSLQLSGNLFQQRLDYEDQWEKASYLKPGETVQQKLKGNIFVRAIASKNNCVVGEPLLVTYKLYTRLHSKSKVTKQPVFAGCSVQEMTTDDPEPLIETENGKDYRVYIIRKVQLFPLQEGTITLDIATVENTVTLYQASKNQLGAEPVSETVLLSNEPLTIKVNALPASNKPAVVNGVGKFLIRSSVLKTNDTANENNVLRIFVDGVGNFQNISCPKVNWPQGIDCFEPTTADYLNKLTFPVAGTKVFEIPFVIKKAGSFIIPSIQLNYYDTELQSYKTISTDSLMVNATAAIANKQNDPRIHNEVNSRQFLWFIPAIALLAVIGLWWQFGKQKSTAHSTTFRKTATENIATDKVVDEFIPQQEPIMSNSSILAITDDTVFYTRCKDFAESMLLEEKDEIVQQELRALLNSCNEILYAPVTHLNRLHIEQQFKKVIRH